MGHRLYVGNLAAPTNSETLRAVFGAMGEVTDVDLLTNPETGEPVGSAFVTMGSPLEAQKAISDLNETLLNGRLLRVTEA